MISSLEVNDVFPRCADQIARLIPFDRLAIVLVDEDAGTKTDAYSVGVDIPGQERGTVTPLADSIAEEILNSGKPLLLGAVELAERAEKYPGSRARVDHGLNSLIAVPLLWRGHPIGYLNIRWAQDDAYGADDIKLVTLIAAQIVGSVAASILYARSEKESASRKELAEIGRIITSSHDVDAVCERFANQAQELIPFDRIGISLLEPDRVTIVDTFVSGVEMAGYTAGKRYVVDETSHRGVIRDRLSTTSVGDGRVGPAQAIDAQKCAVRSGLKSLLITPLISQGKVIGTLTLRSKSENAYGPSEIQIVEQISDHIAGAISISRLYRSLQESEEHYRDLFENAEEMIQTADLEGNILYVNQAWLRKLEYESSDVSSMTIWDIVHSDSQDHCRKIIARILRGESVGEFDAVFRTKMGKKVFVRGTANCGFDDGQPVATHGIFSDVSARLEMERMKEEFVSMVSHELRTPLTSIRDSLGMLASGQLEDKPDQARRMLEIASANTDRLSRLIDDILDIQRIEAPVVDIVLAAVDSRGLIEQATEEMRSFADEAMVQLDASGCRAWVMADRDRVVQTLTNLISNAVKFSEPDSVVKIGCREETESVKFTVSDSGRGIPPEKIETIFERFQQVDSSDSRDKGGTGLGLAISRLIVEQHGGELTVESEMGVGSTFMFRLKRALESDIPAAH